uniref:peptidylprolyl isomerase n=2 Tax=Candidatus Limnocylindrus sp. TaxID=2802978 RepID=UPI00404A5A91
MNPIARLRARAAAKYQAADKTALTNLTFVVIIGLAGALLVGVAGYSVYDSTWAPAVQVNGAGFNKAEAKARAEVTAFQIALQGSRIRARVAAGTMTNSAGDAALQALNEQAEGISNRVTTDLVDTLLIRDLAAANGVTADPAVVGSEWAKEITLPELRLFRRISIDAANDPKTKSPTAATRAAAKAKAEAILAEIKAGGDFATIAKRDSDDSFAELGGLVGWTAKDEDPTDDLGYEAAWALTPSADGSTQPMTDVIARSDDQFVIFRLEKSQASKLDPDFDKQVSDAGIDRGLYERMTEERALSIALSEKITAQLLAGPVEQREVSYVAASVPESDAAQVQVSHILFSPKDDPNTAGDLDPTDLAWAAAEKEANELVARLKNGSDFETEAKESDDTSSGADGGLLAWAPKGTYVPEFDNAIWADGVKSGDILGPIKTQFGYHVIKFDARRTSLKDRLDELATSLAATGVDFTEAATTATNTIEELTFASPGYVPKYTVNPELGAVVWGLKAGGTSAVVESSNTYLIVHVDGVEMRELTDDQIAGIKGSGFSIWLDLYRSAARVAIDGAVVQEAGASPTP